MSQFTTQPNLWNGKIPNREDLFIVEYRRDSEYDDLQTQVLYSGSSMSSNAFEGSVTGPMTAVWFQYPNQLTSGSVSCYIIQGYTQDSVGAPLAWVSLDAFTNDDVRQGNTVSGADGYYTICTSKNTAHYLVAYLAGGPYNYGGRTDINLIPS